MSKQSKRARFAHEQRLYQQGRAVTMRNRGQPGFVGVFRNLRINGTPVAGYGSVFMQAPRRGMTDPLYGESFRIAGREIDPSCVVVDTMTGKKQILLVEPHPGPVTADELRMAIREIKRKFR